MPKIRFSKNIPEIEVAIGTNLMQALLGANLPVASSCHGDGICARCRVRVEAGLENLSTSTALEQMLRDRLKLPRETRISCQSHVLGDITVDTSYW